MTSFNVVKTSLRASIFGTAALLACLNTARAELLTDLVAYWPLDTLAGNKTPDLKSGYDLTAQNITAAQVVAGGHKGNCFSFSAASQRILYRLNAAGEDLPIGNKPSFTVSFWANVNGPTGGSGGAGQADTRVFAESGNSSNTNPLFTIGTKQNAPDLDRLRVLFRSNSPQAEATTSATVKPFNAPAVFNASGWHHIVVVQDGTVSRQVYVDGVADVTLTPALETTLLNATNTAIGGVYRASPGLAWLTGYVDEVAVWKRALTATEVVELRDNGLPAITPPPPPLAIASFTADFPRVAAGRSTLLKWDATSDATITIDQGVGDVTALGTLGVGQVSVSPAADTTYTLTISRGAETPVTRTVTVTVEPGVAAGWDYLDVFQPRTLGNLAGQNPWIAGASSTGNSTPWAVLTEGASNRAITSGSTLSLVALPLNNLKVTEGGKATLFFRFIAPDAARANAVDTFLALSDKGVRFVEEWASNTGPGIHFSRPAGGGLVIEARNGQNAVYTVANFSPAVGQAYEVWIDVDNTVGVTGDIYSVHVAPVGGARTTIFNDFVSDRLPDNVVGLGLPQPNLTSVVLVGSLAGQNSAVLFDDFFLSVGASFTSTVPEAAALTNVAAVPTVGGLKAVAGNGVVNLSWNPNLLGNETYTVRRSATLGGPYDTTLVTGASTTTYQDTGLTNGVTYYYVVAATNPTGPGADSLEVSATPQIPAPAAPANLSATVGDGVVNLSWTASAGAATYTIKSATTSGGPYADLSAGVVTGTTYQASGLVNGTTYYFVVAAVNAGGSSANSNQATATPSANLLSAWREANFPGSTATTGAGANSADADNDGIANLVEYALGTDAKVANASPVTVTPVAGKLNLAFNHIADATLIYTVEATNDLVSAFTTAQTYTGFTTAGATVYIDSVTLASTPKRFLRLKVSAP